MSDKLYLSNLVLIFATMLVIYNAAVNFDNPMILIAWLGDFVWWLVLIFNRE